MRNHPISWGPLGTPRSFRNGKALELVSEGRKRVAAFVILTHCEDAIESGVPEEDVVAHTWNVSSIA